MNEEQQAAAQKYLDSVHFEEYMFFGGCENSERRVLGLFFDSPDQNEFPVDALEFKYRPCYKLTHRDFLGALMSLGIEREAVGDILGGEPLAVDMGEFNNEIFVYVAAFGAFTDVSYDTNQDMKNLFGHIAYIMEGVRRIGDIKSYDLRVEVDGELHEGSYIYGMVTNSVSVGGFKGITGKMSCWMTAFLKCC